MRAFLTFWLIPDLFPEDPEKSSQARLLIVVIWSMILIMLLAGLGTVFASYDPRLALMGIGILTLFNLICYRLVRMKRIRLASGLVMLGLFLYPVYIVASRGTVLIPSSSLFVFMIIVAGALFGKRGVFLSTLAASLAIGGLMVAENAGLLHKQDVSLTISMLVTFFSLFDLTGVMSYMANELTRHALQRSQTENSERKRAEAALHIANQQYRLIADHCLDVIWVLDLNSEKFTFVSPSIQKLSSFTPEEFYARSLQEILTPESYTKVMARLPEQLEKFQRNPSGLSDIYQVDQVCKDGSSVPVEATTSFVMSETGSVQVVGISRDISERNAIEAIQRQQRETLQYHYQLIEILTSISTRLINLPIEQTDQEIVRA